MTARERESREGARLLASERCCALFIARGTTDLTIAEIASEIGISQRTFYRYFPIKAESVAPVLDWTARRSNSVIAHADPDLAVAEVLRLAFRASVLNESAQRTRQLFPLVFRDTEMWSVFMRTLHDGELSVAALLAPRLRMAVGSIAARAAAAAVASSVRIALEDMVTSGADPETAFVQTLSQFTPGPLRRRTDPGDGVPTAARAPDGDAEVLSEALIEQS